MAIILSSNNLPELSNYSVKQRQSILAIASEKLITPQKLILNIIKLFVLFPPFIILARLDSWLLFLPLGFVLIGYFLVMRPISLYFLRKHLPKAIKQFEKSEEK